MTYREIIQDESDVGPFVDWRRKGRIIINYYGVVPVKLRRMEDRRGRENGQQT